MSPEQMRSSKNVDGRTDIWALGAILYHLTCGRMPFVAETLPMMFVKVMQEPPVPPRQVRPGLPPGFEDVILRCLEKDPDRRPANIAELASALAPYAALAEPAGSSPVGAGATAASAIGVSSTLSGAAGQSMRLAGVPVSIAPSSPGKRTAIAGAAATLVIAVAALVVWKAAAPASTSTSTTTSTSTSTPGANRAVVAPGPPPPDPTPHVLAETATPDAGIIAPPVDAAVPETAATAHVHRRRAAKPIVTTTAAAAAPPPAPPLPATTPAEDPTTSKKEDPRLHKHYDRPH
jgi:serine/threonine-protein kinase